MMKIFFYYYQMSVEVVVPVVGSLTVRTHIDPFGCIGQILVGLFSLLLSRLLGLRGV